MIIINEISNEKRFLFVHTMSANNLVTIKTDGVQHHAKFTAAGQCYIYYDEMNNEVWSYSANIFSDGKPYEYLFISGSSCDDLRSIYVKAMMINLFHSSNSNFVINLLLQIGDTMRIMSVGCTISTKWKRIEDSDLFLFLHHIKTTC